MTVQQPPTVLTVRDAAQKAMTFASKIVATLAKVHAFQQNQAGQTAGVPSRQQGPAPTHTPNS